ncbi:MAG: TetR/AcrR family transcriptional regulator [Stackebrandtia sp.]
MKTRLTRAQQLERTHQRLLDAGWSVFARRGYLATTVEEIAAAAGYTRGAVYKHFGGKEGLWQAITDARTEAHLRVLRDALERAGNRDELVAALAMSGNTDEDATRWSVVSAEFLAAAVAQPERAGAAVDAQRRREGEIATVLVRHCDRLGIRPAVPLLQAVIALGALGGGLSLRAVVDPGVDAAAVASVVVAAVFPETGSE